MKTETKIIVVVSALTLMSASPAFSSQPMTLNQTYRTCGHSQDPDQDVLDLVLSDLQKSCSTHQIPQVLDLATLDRSLRWGHPGDGVGCGTLLVTTVRATYRCI